MNDRRLESMHWIAGAFLLGLVGCSGAEMGEGGTEGVGATGAVTTAGTGQRTAGTGASGTAAGTGGAQTSSTGPGSETVASGGITGSGETNDQSESEGSTRGGDTESGSVMSFFVTSRASGCPDPCAQCGYAFDDNDVDENDGNDCSAGSGDLGGLAGADAHCQELADAVGAGARQWRAYLSVQAGPDGAQVDARDRIGEGPWFNAQGVQIAQDLNELHALDPTGEFGAALNGITAATGLTEAGDMLQGIVSMPAGGDHDILTGTRLDGTAFPPGSGMDCDGWTSSSSNRPVQVGHHDGDGIAGGGNDSRSWNSAHPTNCSAAGVDATAGAGYFYCFAL